MASKLLNAALDSADVEERVKQPLRSKQALVEKRIAALSSRPASPTATKPGSSVASAAPSTTSPSTTAPFTKEPSSAGGARDYFKESVAALKAAAAVDARLKKSPDDSELLRQAVERYGEAVVLLQGAVDPANAKVSGKAKGALRSKLGSSQKRLGELEPKLAAIGGGGGGSGAVAAPATRLPAPLLPKPLLPKALPASSVGGVRARAKKVAKHDYFKESVAALKEAAAVDAQLKEEPDDDELIEEAVERYGEAVGLLRGAVDPANNKVPGPMKKALLSKLKVAEKRLAELDPTAAALHIVLSAATLPEALASMAAKEQPTSLPVAAVAGESLATVAPTGAGPIPGPTAVQSTAARVVVRPDLRGSVVDPGRDYFKESVVALKEAAAADARSKRQTADGALRELAAVAYREAAELLRCAVAPANKRVPARTKATLQSKLTAVERRLIDLEHAISAALQKPADLPEGTSKEDTGDYGKELGSLAGKILSRPAGPPAPRFVAAQRSPVVLRAPDAIAPPPGYGTPTGRGSVDDDSLFATPTTEHGTPRRGRPSGGDDGGEELRGQIELLEQRMVRMEDEHRAAMLSMAKQCGDMVAAAKASLAAQELENARIRETLVQQGMAALQQPRRGDENAAPLPTATKQEQETGDPNTLLSEISNIDIERFVETERRVATLEDVSVDLVRGASIALDRLR